MPRSKARRTIVREVLPEAERDRGKQQTAPPRAAIRHAVVPALGREIRHARDRSLAAVSVRLFGRRSSRISFSVAPLCPQREAAARRHVPNPLRLAPIEDGDYEPITEGIRATGFRYARPERRPTCVTMDTPARVRTGRSAGLHTEAASRLNVPASPAEENRRALDHAAAADLKSLSSPQRARTVRMPGAQQRRQGGD